MKLYQFQLVQALKYSSILPVRMVLAMSSVFTSLALVFGPSSMSGLPDYARLFEAAPKWVWASLYATNGVALWWRIVANKPRAGVSRVVNSWTFGLYFSWIWISSTSLGYFPPGNASESMLCLMALWSAIRTDFTHCDRETA